MSAAAFAQQDWKPLWPDGAPGATGTTEHDIPALLAFPASADKAIGCTVLVCPGGGYGGLAMDHEGQQIASWMNERGIHAYMALVWHPKIRSCPPGLIDCTHGWEAMAF
jgi:hypothetical protein